VHTITAAMTNSHPEATFCGQSLKIQRDYPHAVLPEIRQVSAWLTETVKQLRSWERSDDAGRNSFPLGQWSERPRRVFSGCGRGFFLEFEQVWIG
jgi:hypothetical protein